VPDFDQHQFVVGAAAGQHGGLSIEGRSCLRQSDHFGVKPHGSLQIANIQYDVSQFGHVFFPA
jgi:hypothetical protein